MRRIYTRTGDKGMTGIHGGERIPKDDIRIETNGCIDELNAVIGIIRSLLPQEHEWQFLLFTIQKNMMAMMSHVATPSAIRSENPNILPDNLCSYCEEVMDRLMEQMEDNGYFILPGGTVVSAQLQFARAVARRAERRLWTLHKQDPLPSILLQYMNRLSDLFFVMARYEMQQQNWTEEKWQSFAYKRKKKE
jgi:ATP:cob(I)alamin adenosyltransferase